MTVDDSVAVASLGAAALQGCHDVAAESFRAELGHDDFAEPPEELRAKCPVSRAIITSGEGSEGNRGFFNRPLWLVTDYEEGSRALLDRAMTVDMASVLTPEQLAQMPETPAEFQPDAPDVYGGRITGGPWGVAFESSNLDATVAFLRAAGVEVGDPHRAVQGGRITGMPTPLGGIQLAFMGE